MPMIFITYLFNLVLQKFTILTVGWYQMYSISV